MSSILTINNAEFNELKRHLYSTSDDFIPSLQQRVDIDEYARKLIQHSTRIEVWDKQQLIGLVAVYLNDPNRKSAFISSVSVEKNYQGKGFAKTLLHETYRHCRQVGFHTLELEVHHLNKPAQQLYQSEHFEITRTERSSVFMQKQLEENHVPKKL